MNLLRLPLIIGLGLLAGCATQLDDSRPVTPTPNTITGQAKIVPADYSKLQPFKGDRILRYPDFDVVLVSTEPSYTPIVAGGQGPASGQPDGQLFNFQARDRSGRKLADFSWTTVSGDVGDFIVRGQAYRFATEDDSLWIGKN